jgi:2-polyprenyl-3-methyl-5-hydroxy-6-metoxy-1,4-benzoquinol methylase
MKIDTSVEIVDHCILCPDGEIRSDPAFSALLGLVQPYGVKRCDRCGLRWLSPRPTARGYTDLYSYEHYFNGPEVVESYSNLARRRRPYFARRIKHIESYYPIGRHLSILDVGAASGEFVNEALKRGHSAKGFEISSRAREEAYKKYSVELAAGGLEEVRGSAGYDVIHMNHVFEHLPDPNGAMRICQRLLRSGGLLVLEVPNQFYNDLDRLKKVLGMNRKPKFNAYSLHHTYFYIPSTIARLVMKYGFEIKRLRTANPDNTPLRPFNLKNFMLRYYLWLSDRIHQGGNIIEIIAAKYS